MDTTSTLSRSHAPRPRRGAAAQLVLLLDADAPRGASLRLSLREVDEVRLGRARAPSRARAVEGGARVLSLGFADRRVSTAHARLQRLLGAWVIEDLGSKNGTLVDGRPLQRAPLADGALIEVGHCFLLFRAAVELEPGAPDELSLAPPPDGAPATLLPSLAAGLQRLLSIAASDVPVVLLGESGTGKEVAARLVHRASGRRGSFVAVNCGALPANLVESELFGHRKGAFSGALEDRPGLVRSADGGTLFLDEVGDLPPPAQAALLRVLQEKEVLPIGSARPVPVDLRVVCATHRDLQALAAAGSFRRDLLSRLGGFTLALPPLRERREDLGLIIAALLARLAPAAERGVPLSADAARALLRHPWPLNVRELERALAAAVVLAGAGRIELDHLPAELRRAAEPGERLPDPDGGGESPPGAPLTAAEQVRRDQLSSLLREHGGNVTHVAAALGKARTQVQRWLRRFGLDPAAFRR